MPIRSLLKLGHPNLRITATKVDPSQLETPEFKQLLTDMFDTMKDSGGIGIAATQIDVDLQVALIDLPENSDRYKIERPSGLITIINPEIKIINPELQTFWEGCLSVPGLRAPVSRPRGVGLTYMNEEGEKCGLEAHGFMATVIQHELDHLFGTLFVDRVTDNRQLSFESEYEQFHVVKPSE